VRAGEPGLYAASARRVLRARGLSSLGERLRGSDDRLVFVVGSPRSGTTFLAGALGAQAGFVDLSEVNPHKASIPDLVGVPEAEALALVRGWRGVEQTPETAFVLAPALAAYPRGRAVHLVRDGRDVVCSLLERGWLSAGRSGGDDARHAYGPRARFWVEAERRAEFEAASDATRAAWAWRRYVSAARSVDDPRVLELRYEAIAADPASAAQTVAEHLVGDPAALRESLGRFTDTSIGRYRQDLSPEQLEDVQREAGPLLAALGYA
jgi:hypothetical protein